MIDDHEEELLRGVVHEPDDVGRRLVYADWLQTHGDPRGELITVQHARGDRDDDALIARERELVAQAVATLVGLPLPAIRRWELGFIDVLDLSVIGSLPIDVMRGWLASPLLRLVRELRLPRQPGVRQLEMFVAAPFPNLRRLRLGGPAYTVTAGMIERIAGALPRLEGLELGTRSVPSLAAAARLPLRSLGIWSDDLSRAAIHEILAGPWPLSRLALRFPARPSTSRTGASVTLDDLAPVLQGAVFPDLRELGVLHAPFTAALFAALPATPLFARLDAIALDARLLGDVGRDVFERHREAYRRVRFELPNRDAREAFAMAELLRLRLGRPAEAIPLFELVLDKMPHLPHTLFGLANALHDVGRCEESVVRFDELILRDGAHASAATWACRHYALRDLGRCDEALASLERALVVNPRNAGNWSSLGYLQRRLGRWDEALAAFGKALELAPGDRYAETSTAGTLVDAGRPGEALPIYDRLVAARPDDLALVFARGHALLPSDPAAALAVFRGTLDAPMTENVREQARLGAALSLAALGDAQGSLGELDALIAVTDCPAWIAPAWLLAGCTRFASGEAREARELWRRCVPDTVAPDAIADAIALAANEHRDQGSVAVHTTADTAAKATSQTCPVHSAAVSIVAACLGGDPASARERSRALLAYLDDRGPSYICAWWKVWDPLLAATRPRLAPEDAAFTELVVAVAAGRRPRQELRDTIRAVTT